MAKITPSALITAIQGKWNGSCFQMWKGAIVVRRNPRPRKIISESRYNFRGTVSSLSGCFYSMTVNQRIAWRCYALLLPTSVTGYNAFIARGTALEIACHSDLCVYFDAPAAYAPPISPAPIALCYHPSSALYCVMWDNPNCGSVYVQGMLSVQNMYSNENDPKWRIFDTVPSTDLYMIFDASSFPADQMIRFTARSINMRGETSIMAEAKPPPPLPESITLLYPIGGETLYAGASCLIEWRSKSTESIKIEYSLNNGVDWTVIALSVSAYLGQYNWTVPISESAACKVKITNTDDPTFYDESDAVFSIINKPWVTLTAPNGSEEWEEDTKHNITWNQNNVTNVILKYSSDNGLSYNTITASTAAAPGTYEWTIPSDLSTTCLVKILVHENQTIYDISDNTFSITEKTISIDPIAYWILKNSGYDSGNSRFTDQSGNEHHMINHNINIEDDYSTFNGSTSYANCPDFLETTPDRNVLSIVVWIKASNQNNVVFSHLDTGAPIYAPSWYISGFTGSVLRAKLCTDHYCENSKDYSSSLITLDNTWHMFTFTFTGGTLTLHRDTTEDTNPNKMSDASFTTIYDSTIDFILGAWKYGGSLSHFLNGKISKAYVFDGFLTPDDITYLFNLGH